jgi:hypothetical protein
MELTYKGKDANGKSVYLRRGSNLHDRVLISKNADNGMWQVEAFFHVRARNGQSPFWSRARWNEAPTRKEAKAWALARLVQNQQ